MFFRKSMEDSKFLFGLGVASLNGLGSKWSGTNLRDIRAWN